MRYQFRPILKRERKSLIFRMNCFENNVTFAVHNILREKMKSRLAVILALLTVTGCSVNRNIYTIKGSFEECNEPMVWLVSGNEAVDSTQITDGTFTFNGTVDSPIIAYICTAPDRSIAEFECEFILEPGRLAMSRLYDTEVYIMEGSTLNNRLAALEKRSIDMVKKYALNKANSMDNFEKEIYRQWNLLLTSNLDANTDNIFGLYCLRELSYEDLEPEEIIKYLNLFPDTLKENSLWKSLHESYSESSEDLTD